MNWCVHHGKVAIHIIWFLKYATALWLSQQSVLQRSQSGATLVTWVQITRETCHLTLLLITPRYKVVGNNSYTKNNPSHIICEQKSIIFKKIYYVTWFKTHRMIFDLIKFVLAGNGNNGGRGRRKFPSGSSGLFEGLDLESCWPESCWRLVRGHPGKKVNLVMRQFVRWQYVW